MPEGKIICVSECDPDRDVRVTLHVPREVVDRMNALEDQHGEQEGATRRNRLLEALAAMVIQSLDEFRGSDMFRFPPSSIDGNSATLIEGPTNGDKA